MSLLVVQIPTIPLPEPLPAAAPWWIFRLLLLLTFFLHLVAMNLLLGGSLVVILDRVLVRGRNREHYAKFQRSFQKALPVLFPAAITLGVAPLLFSQVLYGRLLYSSSILLGWSWFLVIPLLIVAYYAAYFLSFRTEWNPLRKELLLVLVAVILLCIAFLYTNNFALMVRPEIFGRMYREGASASLNPADPTLAPRLLHTVLGAVSVSGLALAVWGNLRRPSDAAFSLWATRGGVAWFCFSTGVNMLVGTWYFLAFPKDFLLKLMKESPSGVGYLMAGLLFGLVAMSLAILSLQSTKRRLFLFMWAGSLLATLLAMVLLRDTIRELQLAARGFALPTDTHPQWGVILLFAVCLVGGLGLTIWMIRALHAGSRQVTEESLSLEGSGVPKSTGKPGG